MAASHHNVSRVLLNHARQIQRPHPSIRPPAFGSISSLRIGLMEMSPWRQRYAAAIRHHADRERVLAVVVADKKCMFARHSSTEFSCSSNNIRRTSIFPFFFAHPSIHAFIGTLMSSARVAACTESQGCFDCTYEDPSITMYFVLVAACRRALGHRIMSSVNRGSNRRQ